MGLSDANDLTTGGFFFTEAARGGPLTWRIGDDALEGDALGPVRHAHDDAAEYYYMFAGSLHVEVGGVEFVLEEGELCCIPADTPHNVLGPASGTDARMFCVVAPNKPENKWRIDHFGPESGSWRAAVGRPFADATLPYDGTLSAEALALAAGEPSRVVVPVGRESIYLVLSGALGVAVDGLSGTLGPGNYLHVREGRRHELLTGSASKVLRIDCAFTPWAGVVQPGED